MQNYSLNTIASVLKKFLRKIPGGIFGPENEAALFNMINIDDPQQQIKAVNRLMTSLPVYSQHLLVLLFGTFRVIATNSVVNETNMTAQALGVSVAPSFFHTCVSTGKTARMEDVERFKHATKATSYFIEHFGMRDLFGRENYEYYARLTGRILKVEDEWIFFTYPLDCLGVRSDIDLECRPSFRSSHHEMEPTGSLEMIPENCPLDPAGRLSISLDTDGCITSPSSISSTHPRSPELRCSTLDPRRNRQANPSLLTDPRQKTLETKSFACLPQVHQRQAERMRARSDWFLSDPSGLVTYRLREKILSPRPTSLGPQVVTTTSPVHSTSRLPYSSTSGLVDQSDSTPVTGKPPDGQNQGGAVANVALRRRLSDKDKEKRLVRRSSSKRKDKENGGGDKNGSQPGPALKRQSSGDSSGHVHPGISRAASQDSPKGRHSRGGSFDQDSPTVAQEGPMPLTRSLPRI